MLGYFKPQKPTVAPDDLQRFRKVYCTLCQVTKSDFGIMSTALIQHDLVFLMCAIDALPIADLADDGSGDGSCTSRCVLNPLKRVSTMSRIPEVVHAASNLSLFTILVAILNKQVDDKSSAGALLVERLYGKSTLESAQRLGVSASDLDMLRGYLKREQESTDVPDRIIEPVCRFYGELTASALGGGEAMACVARQMCRVMYYLDALEDLQKDMAHNRPNPLLGIYDSPVQVSHYAGAKVLGALREIEENTEGSASRSLIVHVTRVAVPARMARAQMSVEKWRAPHGG